MEKKIQISLENLPNKNIFKIPEKRGSKVINNDTEYGVLEVILNKIIGFSLFMIFFGLPLFFTNFTFQGIAFDKQMYFYFWTLLGLVAWVSKCVVMGEMKIRRTPIDWMIVAFVSVYLIASIASVDKWHSFWGFFGDPSRGFMSLFMVVILYYMLLSNMTEKRFRILLSGLAISSSVIILWVAAYFVGVFSHFGIFENIPVSPIGTLIGTKVFLSSSIIVLLVFMHSLSGSDKLLWLKGTTMLLTIPVILVNILNLAVVYDKTILWIIIVGIGIFLGYIISNIVEVGAVVKWFSFVIFVVLVFVAIIGPSKLLKKELPVEIYPDAKLSFNIAKESMKENLFFGSGPATYGYDFSKFKPQSFNENSFYNFRFYQGSGMLFEMISTIGVIGVIAFFVTMLSMLGINIYSINGEKDKNKAYSLGLGIAWIVVLICTLVYRVDGVILMFVGMIGALSIAALFLESESFFDKEIVFSLKASPKFALALSFIFIVVSVGVAISFVSLGKVYVAEVYAGRVAREEKVSEDGSIKYIVKAINLNKNEGRYYSRASQEYAVLVNEILISGEQENDENVKKIENYINQSVVLAKKGAELMPNDVLAVSVLAQAYELAGRYSVEAIDMSKEEYEKAIELEPNSPSFYLQLGKLSLMKSSRVEGDEKKKLIEDAKENFEKSIEKKNNFSSGHYNLSITKELLGDFDGAIKSTVEAIKLDNKNVDYLYNLARLYQVKGGEIDRKNAEQIFLYILSARPDDVNANFGLGVLYEVMGQNENAIKYYEKTLIIVGDNSEMKNKIEEMISILKNGGSNLKKDIPETSIPEVSAPEATQVPQTPPVSGEAVNAPEVQGASNEVIQ